MRIFLFLIATFSPICLGELRSRIDCKEQNEKITSTIHYLGQMNSQIAELAKSLAEAPAKIRIVSGGCDNSYQEPVFEGITLVIQAMNDFPRYDLSVKASKLSLQSMKDCLDDAQKAKANHLLATIQKNMGNPAGEKLASGGYANAEALKIQIETFLVECGVLAKEKKDAITVDPLKLDTKLGK